MKEKRKAKNNLKQMLKKIGCMAFAMTLAAGCIPQSVMAEETGTSTALPTIDSTKPVSLTITKYITENDSDLGLSDTVYGTEQSFTDKKPLAGVTFSVVKFADLAQSDEADGAYVADDIYLGYKLTEAGAAIWNSATASSNDTTNGTEGNKSSGAIVNGTDLNDFIKDKSTADLKDKLTVNVAVSGVVSAVTDDKGVAKFSSATNTSPTDNTKKLTGGQGLYLVVETNAPSTVTATSHPFFVSLPTTDSANGNAWIYDIYAYPKNKTATTDIDKVIEKINDDTDGIYTTDDANKNKKAEAQIGDTISYKVPLTAVVPEGGLTKLGINDTMSKGLTFNGKYSDASCVAVKYNGTDKSLAQPTNSDYTVSVAKDIQTKETSLKVYFTDDYIAKINASTDKNPKFEFTYSAILNKEAVLGETGNTNSVNFTYNYKNNPTPDTDVNSNDHKTTVYTWGIYLTKNGEDNKALSGVEFTLERRTSADNDTYDILKFIPDDDHSAYNIYNPTSDTDNNISDKITTNDNGKLIIRGLKSGTYRLTETKTQSGYRLLKAPVIIVINGNNTTGEATATVSGKNATLIDDTLDGNKSTNGLVPLTVINHKGFSLPITGAAGIAMNTIIGIVIVCISALLIIAICRKKKAQ